MTDGYKNAPAHANALEKRLRNKTDEAVFLRARNQIAHIAVLQALASKTDHTGVPAFALKGGVALEFEFGWDARSTTDLDVGFRSSMGEMENALLDALAAGWEGFEFHPAGVLEPIAQTGSFRATIKVLYRGRSWSTVKLEIARAEGASGLEVRWIDNRALDLAVVGLPSVESFAAVSRHYALAQKLHACTDRSHPTRENDRSRDLFDIIMLWAHETEPKLVREACVEIFASRDRQPWPPTVVVPPGWPDRYTRIAEEIDFEIKDVHEASELVNRIIAEIDAAQ